MSALLFVLQSKDQKPQEIVYASDEDFGDFLPVVGEAVIFANDMWYVTEIHHYPRFQAQLISQNKIVFFCITSAQYIQGKVQ